MNHEAAKLPILDAFRVGWGRARAQWRPLLSLGALYLLLMLAHDAAMPKAYGATHHFVLALVVEVFQAWLLLVYVRWAISLCDGERLERIVSRNLLLSILPFAATLFLYGAVVSVGLVLFVVPGVLWGLRFAFAPLLVLDQQRDPFGALRESARLTRGVRLPLLGFTMLSFGLNLLGLFALGVGLIITVPVSLIAQVHLLRVLQAATPATEAPPASHPVPAAIAAAGS